MQSRSYPDTSLRSEIADFEAEPQRREAPRTRSGAQAERRKGAGQKQRLQQKGGFGIASSPVPILRIIARLNIGGPAIQAITLTQRLGPPRYESVLVAGETARGEGDMSYLADGSPVNLIKLRSLGRSMNPWRDLKAWLGILGILMRARPRLVHT
ncbi:MAG: hypothetical protein HYY14_00570, partial [Candidatus Omnitrophica bacterium]|nr:hypothetical protein [Candidatus Omnitrophota bacterium]